MSEGPLSPQEKAQIATRIGELDQQIAQRDANIMALAQQLSAARGKKQQPIQTQLAAAQEERNALLQVVIL